MTPALPIAHSIFACDSPRLRSRRSRAAIVISALPVIAAHSLLAPYPEPILVTQRAPRVSTRLPLRYRYARKRSRLAP